MKVYRLLDVDDTGFVLPAQREIMADDDGDAVRKVYELLKGHAVEIWNGRHYVCTLTRNPATVHSDWIIAAKP